MPFSRRTGRAATAAPRSGPVLWLEEAMASDDGPACPPLAGTVRADVCIVGGGYTGLWTALELRADAPDLRVVVVEGQACGFGASGRNGGWATSWYDELDRLVERFGDEQGRWLADQSSAAVARIGETAEEHGFDCRFRPQGSLWTSNAPSQDAVVAGPLAACRRLGRGEVATAVDGAEVERLTGSAIARGGLLLHDSAAVQPALLARGLRAAALRAGVTIHEGSPMLRLERGPVAAVVTASGRVEADQVVLATNVWAARVRELRRAVFVVGTQMVATEPIPERVAPWPWRDGMLFGDARMFVHYAQVTPEGRIVFGRGGGAISAANRVIPKHFTDQATADVVAADFRRWFPQLADVPLTHAWGGPVDRAPGHLPFVGALGDHENIHYGIGYSGNGVGPSALIGRILARRALRRDDPYTRCALVGGPPGLLPPDPLRFAGALAVRDAVQRAESREERGTRADLLGRTAKRLAGFSLPARGRRRPPA
ncbi:NAD(P)/FAD-dependent oxidoreductase [Conexibacter arvalis]|uniref:Glycine/D-amino acid oxidase-like deaminating enzyme n=1 Tax=Conexibacter arvalis TaxID=912552 RepID=A0A840IJE9_9ACTN|nr:FAD-dependent oxidoreductase [Conexibacter arvalis]MBB4664361.1 glycine/D-amino acid oxidase-like deaminating enzyme [Conexibacter arvalis]